jgi:hypothetical protein
VSRAIPDNVHSALANPFFFFAFSRGPALGSKMLRFWTKPLRPTLTTFSRRVMSQSTPEFVSFFSTCLCIRWLVANLPCHLGVCFSSAAMLFLSTHAYMLHLLKTHSNEYGWSRIEFSMPLFRRWTPKSRTSLTRRRGGNTLVWSSLPQRCESHFWPFVSLIHRVPIELDFPRHDGSERLHPDEQVL